MRTRYNRTDRSYPWAGLRRVDLNTHPIPDDSGGRSSRDHSTSEVIFRDHKRHLIQLIANADAVAGCVAWLTDLDILYALGLKKRVSIIVQKEDFLRPDFMGPDKGRLRAAYDWLARDGRWLDYSADVDYVDPTIVPLLSYGDPDSPQMGVRCAGIAGSDRTRPRMHHKFAVFFKRQTDGWEAPIAVWTGSYNWTNNATRSLENAVVLGDPETLNAFYREWAQILAISEPLDWTSEYVDPEFRVGS